MCATAASTPSTTRVEVLRRPVRLAGRTHPRIGGLTRGVAAHLAASIDQRPEERCQQARRAPGVDEHRLGGAADAGAPQLRVHDDRARHVEVRVAVDVDMAVAV
jgi:hypothetical protein